MTHRDAHTPVRQSVPLTWMSCPSCPLSRISVDCKCRERARTSRCQLASMHVCFFDRHDYQAIATCRFLSTITFCWGHTRNICTRTDEKLFTFHTLLFTTFGMHSGPYLTLSTATFTKPSSTMSGATCLGPA